MPKYKLSQIKNAPPNHKMEAFLTRLAGKGVSASTQDQTLA
jgi:hypothetical protein